MAQAKNGDKVRVHYIGTLDDGSIFDASENTEACADDSCSDDACGCGTGSGPLEFVIGQGTLIPKFEQAVIGLEPGQSVKVKIAADDAYGQRAEEMVAVVQRSEIPADINPKPGDQMEVILEDGSPMPVLVTETSDTTITLDANHPLAGLDLNFEIRLVEIL
ncbi:peptidylprolyl isomerase [Geobacter sp. SVR]|uniref:FKBP-type peptidyl-prolyl cis-trans isomerase n=1 Tax=Geobacter sp. SVR TaxID=2495594 RepID=UPI00143EF879|nr:peptidylprolyl isomerase [Geobacter sp. SVR]BCS52189.1 peptidyl-prolyl cis-trans isomerase [Geobacter sp. SVR]GCF85149.1 peptidyl-prolyl cis-trans isomerase [Geobacter sp. SVR]